MQPQVPNGPVVRRVRSVLRLDQRDFPSSGIEASRGIGSDKRVFAVGERSRVVSTRCCAENSLTKCLDRYVWPKPWGPTYRYSYGICIATSCTAMIMCWLFRGHLKRLNAELDREEEAMGVKTRGFRYLL